MPSFPNGMLALGVVLAAAGLLSYWGQTPVDTPPPPPHSEARSRAVALEPFPDATLLAAPWYRPEPVRSAVSAPAPAPAPTIVPSDTSSLMFIGSYSEQDGSVAYFFKDKRNSQVLILKSGQPFKGWSLDSVHDKTFTVIGPGGHYEVAR